MVIKVAVTRADDIVGTRKVGADAPVPRGGRNATDAKLAV
jgi:hypothetical protein